jgi:hypothetical protein
VVLLRRWLVTKLFFGLEHCKFAAARHLDSYVSTESLLKMRYFLVTLALFTIILGSPSKNFSQSLNQSTVGHNKTERKTKVNVNYDKKKDLTTVRLESMILWENPVEFEQVSLGVLFEYPKHIIITPKSVSLVFFSTAQYMTTFHSGELGAVIDGVPLNLGTLELPGNRDLRSPKAALSERLRLSIPYQYFMRIAQGKTIRLDVGGNKYDLSESQIQSLNNFLQLMQQEGVEFK